MNNTETLVDEAGIEILVDYNYEKIDHDNEPGVMTATMVCTELKSVEVVIAGKGIDILSLMTEAQQTAIISKLTYE